MNQLRQDIQALRGFAVLCVVLFHAKVGFFKHGYLGVDVFFVISGYLITKQISDLLANNEFSFVHFYYRRAMRLLPAAYVVLLVCLIFAPLFLLHKELADFFLQTIGALTFSANFVLLDQTNYFNNDASYKPLLHFWSLSLEEQYYFLLPLILVLFGQIRIAMVVLLFCMSLGLYLYYFERDPTSTFYLLHTRFWELGLGSIIALHKTTYPTDNKVLKALLFAVVIALVAVPFYWQSFSEFSKYTSLIVCCCTALVICAKADFLNKGILITLLAKIGLISYSVYLVHWPIFSFLDSAYLSGGIAWEYRLTAIVLSFILGLLLYHFVEQRFRVINKETHINKKALLLLVVLPIALIMILLFQYEKVKQHPDYMTLQGIQGLSDQCGEEQQLFGVNCTTGDNPTSLIWGDSHAMHLVPGVVATADYSIAQATKSSCAPILDLSLNFLGSNWARHCHNFNQYVFNQLTSIQSVETIVLSAQWGYLLNQKTVGFIDNLEKTQVFKRSTKEVAVALSKTIAELRKVGKKVIVVASTRGPNINAGQCVLRERYNKLRLDSGTGCNYERKNYSEIDGLFIELQNLIDVNVIRLESPLCDNTECVTELGGKAIYRDESHLSKEGSIILAKLADWSDEFINLAK